MRSRVAVLLGCSVSLLLPALAQAAGQVKAGAAVLDVGLTRTEQGIRGDVDPAVADVAGYLTPMPGGTGPMTIALLLRSAVKAARFRRGILAYPSL